MKRGVLFALLLGVAGCGTSKQAPEVHLPTLGTSELVSLRRCPTPKCLTVYVAPWCPYCRASSALIRALRDYLKTHNVTTRVVVGADRIEAVNEYAREFGPDTLLDPNGAVNVGGVPHFIVTDASGRVLKDVAGAPPVSPPWNEGTLSQFAGLYGLP